MDGVAVGDAVTLLRHAVDGLLASGLDALSSPDLVGVLTELEVERRRLDAVDVRVLGEVQCRGVAGEFGRTSTADLLTHALRVAPYEARARVGRVGDLGARREPSGTPLLALLPAAAGALAAGEVSVAHTDVIGRCLDGLPPELPVQVLEVAEAFLVEAARHEDPAALRRTAELVSARLNPDGVAPRDELVERRRGVTLADRGDGSVALSGRLTGETAAVWRTILDALSAPIPAGPAGPGGVDPVADNPGRGPDSGPDSGPDRASGVGSGVGSAAALVRDERSAAQRRHDGLLEAGLRLLRAGTLPESGGTPVTVLVRATPADLETPDGLLQTAHGGLISTRSVLRLAGDTALCGIRITTGGAVLDCGQTQRLATPAQRRALAARDGGCSFPGCTRPAAWCQVAHITAWVTGGPTDLENLCLLCPHHHRRYDSTTNRAAGTGSDGGGDGGSGWDWDWDWDWEIVMIDRLPHWRPPPWIDPYRQPIRNRAHHLPEIDFTTYADTG